MNYYGTSGKLHVADNLPLKQADNDCEQWLHTIFEDDEIKIMLDYIIS